MDYGTIYEHREKVLRKAFQFHGQKALEKFRKKNAGWVEDYALYMAVKAQMGLRAWNEWEEDIRMRRPEALKKWKAKCAEDIEYHIFVQYLFFEQWTKLKKYANEGNLHYRGRADLCRHGQRRCMGQSRAVSAG